MAGKRLAVDEQRTKLLEQRFDRRGLRPLIIGGFEVCYHARIRMAARRIEPEWVADALRAPGRPNSKPGTRKHLGNMAMCVVEPKTKQIITIGYGRLNNPEKVHHDCNVV